MICSCAPNVHYLLTVLKVLICSKYTSMCVGVADVMATRFQKCITSQRHVMMYYTRDNKREADVTATEGTLTFKQNAGILSLFEPIKLKAHSILHSTYLIWAKQHWTPHNRSCSLIMQKLPMWESWNQSWVFPDWRFICMQCLPHHTKPSAI